MAGLTFGQTQSGNLTLLVSGGFLFGGLMFGPDLDIYSCQYQRWGWFRWLWLPYQKSLRHRSLLSHGPLIGTALRILYLAIWIAVLGIVAVTIAQVLWGLKWSWHDFIQLILRSLSEHYTECFALYIGLELGAMSHSLSDWTGSAYKRCKKQGWKGLFPPATKSKQRQRKSPVRPPKKPKF